MIVDAGDAIAATTGLMDRVNREVRRQIKRTCKQIIKETPVEKGRLKNNWYASNRRVGIRTNKSNDPSGKRSLARVEKALDRLRTGKDSFSSTICPTHGLLSTACIQILQRKELGKHLMDSRRKLRRGCCVKI